MKPAILHLAVPCLLLAGSVAPLQSQTVQINSSNLPPEVLEQLKQKLLEAEPEQKDEEKKPGEKKQEQPSSGNAEVDAILKTELSRRPADVLKALADAREKEPDTPAKKLQQAVATRDWPGAGEVIAALPEEHRVKVYEYLLDQLKLPSFTKPELKGDLALNDADLLALARIAPEKAEAGTLSRLQQRFTELKARGGLFIDLEEELKKGVGPLGGEEEKDRIAAARLLMALGNAEAAADFLPDYDRVVKDKDADLLQLHKNVAMARSHRAKEPKQREELRDRAWEVVLFMADDEGFDENQRKSARQEAVNYALNESPDHERWRKWLRKKFTTEPEMARELLRTTSEQVQKGERDKNANSRLSKLRRQQKVIAQLLEVTDASDTEWDQAIELATAQWLQEARHSKAHYRKKQTRQQPQQNPYYYNPYMQQPQPPVETSSSEDKKKLPAIDPAQLLGIAPGEEWLARLPSDVTDRVNQLVHELALKAEETDPSYEALLKLAKRDPEKAGDMLVQYLNSWAGEKDPNKNSPRRSYYYYGGNQMSNRIPLTRAMQLDNMRTLREKLDEFQELGVEVEPSRIVSVFDRIRSNAEIYEPEELEVIFGQVDGWTPKTATAIGSRLRMNLASKWRQKKVQQTAKTKRTDEMLQEEVKRGYALLDDMIGKTLQQEDAGWELLLLKAQAQYDRAEYLYGINEDLADYTAARERAFATFAEAADAYAKEIAEDGTPNRLRPMLYHAWFNAAMGASDAQGLARQQDPDRAVIKQIGEAIRGLPEESVDKHLEAFAHSISRPAGISPELRPRYVRSGLEILGDHESGDEARELLAFYDSLLEEVKLHAELDGSGVIGHDQPFGIRLSLHHTENMGREAGGFGRYLQNQKQNQNYYYGPTPPGARGPQDYRDALDQKIREALVEGYEVISITYFDPGAEPRALPDAGWREKPLAFILAKAKDTSRDQIGAIQMDLDFMDPTNQPVVLPVESAPILVDARPEKVPARPVKDATVEMLLDDRKAAEGHITLEVTAKGEGILPPLDTMVDLSALEAAGLEVAENEDQGLSVASLETEGDNFAAMTEQSWFLKLVPQEGAGKISSFRFPAVRLDGAEAKYLRYNDADVEEVEPTVALAGFPLRRGYGLLWLLVFLLLLGGAAYWLWRRKQQEQAEGEADPGVAVPENPTVFGALAFLRRLKQERRSRFSADQLSELQQDIDRVESRYFSAAADDAPEPDIHPLLRKWGRIASTGNG